MFPFLLYVAATIAVGVAAGTWAYQPGATDWNTRSFATIVAVATVFLAIVARGIFG